MLDEGRTRLSIDPMTGSGWVEKAGLVYVGDRTFEADARALAAQGISPGSGTVRRNADAITGSSEPSCLE